MCSNYDLSKLNVNQTFTVTYKGLTTTYPLRCVSRMNFDDVTEESWYYQYVLDVYNMGYMSGMNSDTFGAIKPLARAQFAAILYRMSEKPAVTYHSKFPDVAAGVWYTNPIMWASSNNIVTGYTNTGLFGPSDNITREQIVVMMYRYAQFLGLDTSNRSSPDSFQDASYVSSFAKDAMEWAVAELIITGKDNKTRLDPQGLASRAECATIIDWFSRLM